MQRITDTLFSIVLIYSTKRHLSAQTTTAGRTNRESENQKTEIWLEIHYRRQIKKNKTVHLQDDDPRTKR